ncbi:methyltransferase [Streptomyces axinellae]|uniref:Methyltransferase n=1 Tax=Streptomyces axinellae TaxID=552788 RepID=A0ABN3PU63_9ACTN
MTDIADNTPSALPLMQLTSAFWGFKTFAAAVELGLFTRLADGRAMSLEEAADELDIRERPADMFLAACASLGLLEKDGEKYRNSALSEEFLVEGKPRYFGGFVRYCDQREYPVWHRIVDAMRTDRPLTWDPDSHGSVFVAENPVMMEFFWESLHSISASTAHALADAYDFGPHSRLLDVGGGSAGYPVQLCRRYPHLSATVFDLEHVCAMAEQKVRAAGLEKSIATVAGDFMTDEPLPGGHDVILLSMILHDWDETTNRALLRKCWEALAPGGAIVICELLLNPERTGPASAALMGMNMIVETEGGKNYSETEYQDWLTDAGFEEPRVIRFDTAGANGAVVARKQ